MDCLHKVSQVHYLQWILPEEARNVQVRTYLVPRLSGSKQVHHIEYAGIAPTNTCSNPLAPGRPRKKSAACETSFLDRSQRHLVINFCTIAAFPAARLSLVLNACGYYISWCTKFGQIFHLNLGARLAIHGSMHNGIL
jgi:hypothetical protein